MEELAIAAPVDDRLEELGDVLTRELLREEVTDLLAGLGPVRLFREDSGERAEQSERQETAAEEEPLFGRRGGDHLPPELRQADEVPRSFHEPQHLGALDDGDRSAELVVGQSIDRKEILLAPAVGEDLEQSQHLADVDVGNRPDGTA